LALPVGKLFFDLSIKVVLLDDGQTLLQKNMSKLTAATTSAQKLELMVILLVGYSAGLRLVDQERDVPSSVILNVSRTKRSGYHETNTVRICRTITRDISITRAILLRQSTLNMRSLLTRSRISVNSSALSSISVSM